MALPKPTRLGLIAKLALLLRKVGLDPTSQDLADLLWLAGYLDEPSELPESQLEPPTVKLPPPPQPHSQPETSSATTPFEPAITPALEPRAGVYSGEHTGLNITTPGGVALPGKLTIGRALRPLIKRVPSPDQFELDEEATIQRIADENNWLPVLRPALARWLELDLVVDEWSSMVVWQPVVYDFRHFLEQCGAFGSVRTWGMETAKANHTLRLHAGQQAAEPSWRSPKELVEPRGNRLIMVLSDCLSPTWYDGQMGRLLATWGRNQMVVLVQMLPERLWLRTGLGNATPVWLRARTPSTPNHRLQQRLPLAEQDELSTRGFPVPVMTLEPEMIAIWANLVVGQEHIWTPGFLLPLDDAVEKQRQNEVGILPELDPEERLKIFRSMASPLAYQLATYLAAAPLSLPVMRLVQHVMLPNSRQVHLAEFFLSGLIRRDNGDEMVKNGDIRYNFLPGVRELLLHDAPVSDTFEVLRSVSRFVDRHTGRPIDFRAIVGDPTILKSAQLEADGEAFASIAIQVLQQLGGRYSLLVSQLERRLAGIANIQQIEPGINVSTSNIPLTPSPNPKLDASLISSKDYKKSVRKLLTSLSDKQSLSPSAYDTGWVARLSAIDPAFGKGSNDWLCENQLVDGSWGATEILFYHDRLVCTLSAMIALCRTGRRVSDRKRLEKGLMALERLTAGATQGLMRDPSFSTVGFELIVPSLVGEAEKLGLIKHQGDRILGRLSRQRAIKIEKLKGIKINRYMEPAFSAEFVGADGLALLDKENLQEINGSVAFSPSATAFYSLYIDADNSAALEYLRRTANDNGSVPFLAPLDIRERALVLWNLMITDLFQDKEITKLCQPHLDFLQNNWRKGEGIGSTAGSMLADGDDTGLVYEVLAKYGHNVDLESLKNFETDDHFYCFPLEANLSVSTNIHILGALRQAGVNKQDPAVKKILGYLHRSKEQYAFWTDKWHVSPYYATTHAIIIGAGFADELFDKESALSSSLVGSIVDWILVTQNADGSWGSYLPTAEETAYCLQALCILKQRGWKISRESIKMGAIWLEEHIEPPYPSLWISKCLYCPELIVRSAILSALYLSNSEK